MKLNRFRKFETFWSWKYETSLILERDIETMYSKSLLISIVEKIAMSIIEAISDADLIIDEMKTLVFGERNVVDKFAKIITWRKLNEKNSKVFMMNWFSIDVDCQKLKNRIMIKIRVMFERLLICVSFFFFLFFNQQKLALYFFRIVLFILFFFFFFFSSLKQLLKSLSHFFFTTTTFRLKIRFFSFCRFISLLLFVFVTQCFIWRSLTHVLIEMKFISSQFHRFLSWESFLSIFLSVVSVFVFRSLSSLWCLKFFVVRCFLSVFEFYDSDRRHSSLMFSHVVVFSKEEFDSFCFCLSWTLLCFDILLSFAHSEDTFFDVFEEFLSSIINVRKWDMCSRELMMNRK